jgi:phosphoesterase RecJ-like protein
VDTDIKFRQALARLRAAQNVLIVTHYNPDGDALASTCAMVELCGLLGIRNYAFCPSEPAVAFDFLPHLDEIRFIHHDTVLSDGNNLGQDFFSRFDLIVVLDCGSKNRTKLEELIDRKTSDQFLIEIDHHPKIEDYADLELRDDAAAATAELVYGLIKTSGVRINKNLANCLLAGILTDTGNFLYPATSDATIKIASEMLGYGAHLPRIIDNILHNKTLSAMKLWGLALANLKINPEYNIACTVLSLEAIKDGNTNKDEIDGISNFLGNLYGVKAVILLREEEGGLIRGNIRSSHPMMDVSKLAILMGGGGHTKAAGFTINGKLEKTEKGWRIL